MMIDRIIVKERVGEEGSFSPVPNQTVPQTRFDWTPRDLHVFSFPPVKSHLTHFTPSPDLPY